MAENGSTKRKSVESLRKKDDSKKAKFDPKKNNKKKAFIYGNYDKYYGYRLLDHSQKKEDPRLAVFKKEWFEGKECLDIGCNRGLITMTIVSKIPLTSKDKLQLVFGNHENLANGNATAFICNRLRFTKDLISDQSKEVSLSKHTWNRYRCRGTVRS